MRTSDKNTRTELEIALPYARQKYQEVGMMSRYDYYMHLDFFPYSHIASTTFIGGSGKEEDLPNLDVDVWDGDVSEIIHVIANATWRIIT